MLVTILYFGAIVGWLAAHCVVQRLRNSRILSAHRFKISHHCLQVIFVIAAAIFDFRIRPALAVLYSGAELAWGPYALIYGVPTGTLVSIASLCIAIDVGCMYLPSNANDCHVFRPFSFWGGVACGILVPVLAIHPLCSITFFEP
ncbi:MAG: hypothetical protein HQ582_07870 [Planctomycetes bacterium]|nr:hypothetical protein [Planctomycetota bacterium]